MGISFSAKGFLITSAQCDFLLLLFLINTQWVGGPHVVRDHIQEGDHLQTGDKTANDYERKGNNYLNN